MAYRYEKNYGGGTDIVIDGWENGIAISPHAGIADLRDVDIEQTPGVVTSRGPVFDGTAQNGGISMVGFTATFTADATTDILTASTSIPTNYLAVTFSNSGGSLPTGISAGTIYWLVYTTGTSPITTVKVATTLQNAVAGTTVNITANGSGTNTITVVPFGRILHTDSQWYQLKADSSSTSVVYAIDHNSRLWGFNYATSNNWTLISGNLGSFVNGIAVFQNWLFIFRDNKIDVFGKLTGAISTHTWYTNWKTLAGSTPFAGQRKTLVGQDNVLYWTDYDDAYTTARLGYIGSLREVSGQTLFADTGNPSTSNSTTNYTFNNNSLDFAGGEQPVALSELNSKLVIATSMNSGYSLNKEGRSHLYTWDRVSASFDYPLELPFANVADIKNVNNILYIFGGRKGIVYKTDFSSVREAFSIPRQLFTLNSGTTYYEGNPLNSSNGLSNLSFMETYGMQFGNQSLVSDNKLYFALSNVSMTGLYMYNIETGKLCILATPRYGAGTDVNTDMVGIYSLAFLPSFGAPGIFLAMFGGKYTGSTTYFIDFYYTPNNNSSNSYASKAVTDLVPLGTNQNKKTIEQIEYKLDKKMGTQSGIKLYYRTAIGDSWNLITTDDYSTYGSIASRNVPVSISDAEWVQIKVELEYNTRLKEIRLR